LEKKSFTLTSDYIELKNLLKLVNLVQSGGEAKIRIQSGEAQVNGEIETRRGKKLYAGDIVIFDALEIKIIS
jgi:ribosome-associated protein